MLKSYFVYILTNWERSVFYIGVTGNLPRRILEHKLKINRGFTCEYNCSKLVYYAETGDVCVALEREKQLKHWHRQWKINLINQENQDWRDLSLDFLNPDLWLQDPETSSGGHFSYSVFHIF
ncbi:MAG TPA: GIY-YIG nuclease family protein [Candidatus Gracilibacteria bacterium]